MAFSKLHRRKRRAGSIRRRISELGGNRLSVFRTPRHIYAQIFDETGSRVLASASTLEADVKKGIKFGGNADAATVVGKLIAKKAKAAGVTRVAFDRSGFAFHGRIKALADAARESGLEF